ncbi:MAG: hypothetical protein AVDCRST_MAG05-2382 [uncultured Rubrobacteraceae bacterium]|uniref:Uncharacterized protein n=1 Tax=uncultured Rubrobacteraceae bacterium TaxID=349277 RepID=A0A6J4SIG3_9ACTN|nr:MAG: hypothetical protein AVDCRST_MAG05-2382 [uncultured Rubrobacteraceae bacterium]
MYAPHIRPARCRPAFLEVAEDEGYRSRRNAETVERFGGSPCMPSETGAVSPKDDPKWDNMYYTFMCNWQLSSECYRRRSDVEQVFSMVKGKFRDSVRPRDDEGAGERGTGEGSV